MILRVTEGEQVSYADIQKKLHKYIKDNDLRNPLKRPTLSAPPNVAAEVPRQPPVAAPQPQQLAETIEEDLAGGRYCQSCGAHIPSDAIYCDMCGEGQHHP